MLLVTFHVGADRYALDSRQVTEVVPLMPLRALPHSPSVVAGLFNYRGAVVPVIDLCSLMGKAPCRKLLSSRILLVTYPAQDGSDHLLGLLAERIVETMAVKESDLVPTGIDLEEAPYLGRIVCIDDRMIQCLRVEHVLPDSLRSILFRSAEGVEGANGSAGP